MAAESSTPSRLPAARSSAITRRPATVLVAPALLSAAEVVLTAYIIYIMLHKQRCVAGLGPLACQELPARACRAASRSRRSARATGDPHAPTSGCEVKTTRALVSVVAALMWPCSGCSYAVRDAHVTCTSRLCWKLGHCTVQYILVIPSVRMEWRDVCLHSVTSDTDGWWGLCLPACMGPRLVN